MPRHRDHSLSWTASGCLFGAATMITIAPAMGAGAEQVRSVGADPPLIRRSADARGRRAARRVPYGFQFKRSVIGGALDSASTLMRNRPSLATSY